MIAISIPIVAPSLNQQKRMHFAAYGRMRARFAMEIWAALGGRIAALRANPMAFARITITRHNTRGLDYDNWVGAAKPIIDVLRPVSTTNPNGLGIIEDDDASHVAVTYLQAIVKKGAEHTTLTVEAGRA